jgi:hypothetical protein
MEDKKNIFEFKGQILEDVDINEATFDLTSIEKFIISFERLPKSRIVEIIKEMSEDIQLLALQLLVVDPGGYDRTRDNKTVPRSDDEIIKKIKSNNLYELFEQLYTLIVTETVNIERIKINKGEPPKEKVVSNEEDTLEQPNEEPEQYTNKKTEPSDLQISENKKKRILCKMSGINIIDEDINKVVIKEKKDLDNEVEYSVIIENIDEYNTELEIEDVVSKKINAPVVECNFFYETIDGELLESYSTKLHSSIKNNCLSGLVKITYLKEDGVIKNKNDDNNFDNMEIVNEIQNLVLINTDSDPNLKEYLDGFCEYFDITFSNEKKNRILELSKNKVLGYDNFISNK